MEKETQTLWNAVYLGADNAKQLPRFYQTVFATSDIDELMHWLGEVRGLAGTEVRVELTVL